MVRGVGLAILLTALAAGGPARAAECTNSRPLGVSRIAEIDTTGGQLFGTLQYQGNAEFLRDREVVLTFDDGPHPDHTVTILKALAAECTRATFFVVGRMAVAYPDTLDKVLRGGHTVGLHTWSHGYAEKLPPERVREDFEMAASALPRLLGRPVAPFFRFPFLSDPMTAIDYVKSRDFAIFSIDIDSYDSRGFSADRIVRHTMKLLHKKGRGILLFHDLKRTTAAALPRILRLLKTEGFKIVHMVPARPATMIADYDAELNVVFSKRFAAKTGKDGKPGAPSPYPRQVVAALGAPMAVPSGGQPATSPGIQIASNEPPEPSEPADVTSATRVRDASQGPIVLAALPPAPATSSHGGAPPKTGASDTSAQSRPAIEPDSPSATVADGGGESGRAPADEPGRPAVTAPVILAAAEPQRAPVSTAPASEPEASVATSPEPQPQAPPVVAAAAEVASEAFSQARIPVMVATAPTNSFLALSVPRNRRLPRIELKRLSAATPDSGHAVKLAPQLADLSARARKPAWNS